MGSQLELVFFSFPNCARRTVTDGIFVDLCGPAEMSVEKSSHSSTEKKFDDLGGQVIGYRIGTITIFIG